MSSKVRKVVLAYSGGLDTSIIIPWLRDNYGADVIAFTGGVGENSALVRERCLERFGYLGVELDATLNRQARVDGARSCVEISTQASTIRALVVTANEERMMAEQAVALLASS